METIEITSVSSKGQVVIPKSIRSQLSIGEGTKFIVIADGSNLLLKKINEPDKAEFDALIRRTREVMKSRKVTPKDLQKAIKASRAKRAR
ncbi:AbrB/MazE/SpoVT family DNA-binding domain-containing protein [Turneriella parva]|jgi:AbrB family looped-hinge helix DNA binding protein|uniref:Transcriptional regulator, AbrB family n=1 Tax=Turneriella parva (strain ATCC BAA-1111 / DSM 21527 / NCTC 11395 / H) TaxID=869212 RepID=I4B9W0_TURPD|nr:AbrB/MazE/SpoVT family DNA-binding domain-containing protein [Turneriella parva]AFM14067.1 transcriptional regulator, AbrB family [Turneriella parva DSM 21527]